MGEIADMMLDGTLCASCGVYEDHEQIDGVPWLCPECLKDPKVRRAWGREEVPNADER